MKIGYKLLTVIFIFFSSFVYSQEVKHSSLDSLLYKKRSFNALSKRGYQIQIYNGDEKKASAIEKQFREAFPEIVIKRIYKVPEWKIQTGIYQTRIEADRVLNSIKSKYKGARVL
ncbi:MAG: hypothetical protein ACPHXR_08205 [Flavicella sp.]